MRKGKYVIGIVIIIVAFGLLVLKGLDRSMMAYVNVSELMKGQALNISQEMQITGIVQPGSIQEDPDQQRFEFVLQDVNDPEVSVAVQYSGLIPENFKPGIQVVVQGVLKKNRRVIEAQEIFVKCPSKYESSTES